MPDLKTTHAKQTRSTSYLDSQTATIDTIITRRGSDFTQRMVRFRFGGTFITMVTGNTDTWVMQLWASGIVTGLIWILLYIVFITNLLQKKFRGRIGVLKASTICSGLTMEVQKLVRMIFLLP
jgi:hypothetical protein